mgnify:CR=1 FL=1
MNMRERTHSNTNNGREASQETSGRRPETWPELKEHLAKTLDERAEFLGGTFFPLSSSGFKGFSVSDVDTEKHRAQIVVSYHGQDAKGQPITRHLTFRLFKDAGREMQMTGDKIPSHLGVSREALIGNICETLERFNPNLWVFLEDPGRDVLPTQTNRKPGVELGEPVPIDERRLEFFQSQPGLECAIATGTPSEVNSDEDSVSDHIIRASGISGYCHFVFPKGVISDSAICANAPYFFRFASPLPENALRDIVLDRSITKNEKRGMIRAILEKTEFFTKVTQAKAVRKDNGERYAAKHPDIDADETIRDKWYGELQKFIANTLR